MVSAHGFNANIKEIIALLIIGIAFILILPKLLAMTVRNTAAEVTGIIGDTGKGIKDSFDNTVNAVLNPNKTDIQTLSEITAGKYNIKYADMTPEAKAELQLNLGKTKSYYELHKSRMTWDAFQDAIGIEKGGYGEGFDGTTTISRSLVPPGYTGEYYAGKRVI